MHASFDGFYCWFAPSLQVFGLCGSVVMPCCPESHRNNPLHTYVRLSGCVAATAKSQPRDSGQ